MEDKMGGACGVYWREKMCVEIFVGETLKKRSREKYTSKCLIG
jgi:hypothetical protein